MTVAAIVDQELEQRLHSINIRAINDGATVAGCAQESRTHQDRQMRRKAIVRCTDRFGDHACRDANRLVLDQKPKDSKARRLRQRRERGNGVGFGELIAGRHGTGVACDGKHGFAHLLHAFERLGIVGLLSGLKGDRLEHFYY